MPQPMHVTSGFSNCSPGDPLYMFGLPDPTKWIVFFDDFMRYNAADWVITTTEAGAGDATEALANEAGGVLLITNDAADNDADFFQKVGEFIRWSSTKRLFMKGRLKVSDATQSDWIFGLQILDTTPLAVTDGIYFRKDDGDTEIDAVVVKDSTATTSTAIATCGTAYMELAIVYLPDHPEKRASSGKFCFYVDGVLKATLASTNAPDDEELTVSFGIQNGEAVAKTMSVDYILVAHER